MKVQELVSQLGDVSVYGEKALLTMTIADLCYNTAHAATGMIFFALKGRTTDGSRFIPKAYEQGCRVFVSESVCHIPEDALLIVVENSRLSLSYAAHLFFGKPSHTLKVVGITGTKGKTTTTTLLYKVLKQAGLNAGVIGTNGIYYADTFVPTQNTTPESYDIHKTFRAMLNAGVNVCFMEVSSQGLMMQRVEHVAFDMAVFTNMAIDHIGELEHPTFENYLQWKAHLFSLARTALVNADDEYVEHFMTNSDAVYYTYGVDAPANFRADNIQYLFNDKQIGMQFTFTTEHIKKELLLGVPGKFNVYNALVVLAIASLLGVQEVETFLSTAQVSGRMEVVPNDKGVLALLDYAHNGFSLEQVVQTLQHYTYKRLIILFGSVGDRSQTRRKELGDVVARYADIAMITSDNPGKENPQQIIDEIKQSFAQSTCQVYQEVDRRLAIEQVVNLAQAGDIVVFAGKGHETYQIIGTEKVPFNEREIIIEAFNR